MTTPSPEQDFKHPDNVPGKYWVGCNVCSWFGICTETAPNNFRFHDERFADEQRYRNSAFVFKQPENQEEEEQCHLALQICPVAAIHDDGNSHKPEHAAV